MLMSVKNKQKAKLVHIKLIEIISEIFDTKKAKFVQISTDHLFDGSKNIIQKVQKLSH